MDGCVAPESNRGYGASPLPSERDGEIAALVAYLVEELRPDTPNLALEACHAPVLLAFAERMATLAIRRHSADHLRDGLRAVALAGSVASDPREVLLILPLLWRSAQILGLDPSAEFGAIGRSLAGPGGEQLIAFLSRSEEDRGIQAMGYSEAIEEDGFRYRRTW